MPPLLMRIVIPEDLLNCDSWESTLTPLADRFLTDMMPRYAALVCGPIESHTDSIVIESIPMAVATTRCTCD